MWRGRGRGEEEGKRGRLDSTAGLTLLRSRLFVRLFPRLQGKNKGERDLAVLSTAGRNFRKVLEGV